MENKPSRSIATNFLYNMVYQISLVILPLITSPYLSRVIGPEGLGNYSFSYSVAYYFYLISMLGINNYGNRSIAAVRDKQQDVDYTFSRIYYFQFIVSAITTVAYLIYCIAFCKTNTSLAFAQVLYVLSALINVNWLFFGIEEFKITVIRKTAIKILTSICVFVFVKSVDDLLLYTLIIAGAEFLGEVYLLFYVPRYVHFRRVRIREIFSGTKEIVILCIPIIATSVYRYMDKIMLGSLSNMNNVGQYDYAEKIIMICLGCMTALGTVMLPKMANLIARNKISEVKEYLINSMQFAMFMACGIAFGLSAVAMRLAVVYFGENYTNCGIAMFYLSLTVLPIAWANVVRTQYLIPSSKDKEYLISVAVGAVLNFVLNYTLIPKWGIQGAIVGTITAEFAVAIVQTILVRKEIEAGIYIKNTVPFFVSGVIMFVITRFVGEITNDSIVGLLLQVIIGFTIYVTLTAGYCVKTKNSIYRMIVSKIKRKGLTNK